MDLSHPDAAVVMRRIIVDHINTGLQHPVPAVRRQAIALATEMDVAGLNVDQDLAALKAQR